MGNPPAIMRRVLGQSNVKDYIRIWHERDKDFLVLDVLSFQIESWDKPRPATVKAPKNSFEWWREQVPENSSESWYAQLNK